MQHAVVGSPPPSELPQSASRLQQGALWFSKSQDGRRPPYSLSQWHKGCALSGDGSLLQPEWTELLDTVSHRGCHLDAKRDVWPALLGVMPPWLSATQRRDHRLQLRAAYGQLLGVCKEKEERLVALVNNDAGGTDNTGADNAATEPGAAVETPANAGTQLQQWPADRDATNSTATITEKQQASLVNTPFTHPSGLVVELPQDSNCSPAGAPTPPVGTSSSAQHPHSAGHTPPSTHRHRASPSFSAAWLFELGTEGSAGLLESQGSQGCDDHPLMPGHRRQGSRGLPPLHQVVLQPHPLHGPSHSWGSLGSGLRGELHGDSTGAVSVEHTLSQPQQHDRRLPPLGPVTEIDTASATASEVLAQTGSEAVDLSPRSDVHGRVQGVQGDSEKLEVPKELRCFWEAHRLIVVDAVRTDFQKHSLTTADVVNSWINAALVDSALYQRYRSSEPHWAQGVWVSGLARNQLDHTSHLSGDQKRQVARLINLLSAYALHDPAVGYCQGMSDLALPFLLVLEDDGVAFWCFCALMAKVRGNFSTDESHLLGQLRGVSQLVASEDPELYQHLTDVGATDCHFAYRMIMVLMRRELPLEQTLRLWEMLWADDWLAAHPSTCTGHQSTTCGVSTAAQPQQTAPCTERPAADNAPGRQAMQPPAPQQGSQRHDPQRMGSAFAGDIQFTFAAGDFPAAATAPVPLPAQPDSSGTTLAASGSGRQQLSVADRLKPLTSWRAMKARMPQVQVTRNLAVSEPNTTPHSPLTVTAGSTGPGPADGWLSRLSNKLSGGATAVAGSAGGVCSISSSQLQLCPTESVGGECDPRHEWEAQSQLPTDTLSEPPTTPTTPCTGSVTAPSTTAGRWLAKLSSKLTMGASSVQPTATEVDLGVGGPLCGSVCGSDAGCSLATTGTAPASSAPSEAQLSALNSQAPVTPIHSGAGSAAASGWLSRLTSKLPSATSDASAVGQSAVVSAHSALNSVAAAATAAASGPPAGLAAKLSALRTTLTGTGPQEVKATAWQPGATGGVVCGGGAGQPDCAADHVAVTLCVSSDGVVSLRCTATACCGGARAAAAGAPAHRTSESGGVGRALLSGISRLFGNANKEAPAAVQPRPAANPPVLVEVHLSVSGTGRVGVVLQVSASPSPLSTRRGTMEDTQPTTTSTAGDAITAPVGAGIPITLASMTETGPKALFTSLAAGLFGNSRSVAMPQLADVEQRMQHPGTHVQQGLTTNRTQQDEKLGGGGGGGRAGLQHTALAPHVQPSVSAGSDADFASDTANGSARSVASDAHFSPWAPDTCAGSADRPTQVTGLAAQSGVTTPWAQPPPPPLGLFLYFVTAVVCSVRQKVLEQCHDADEVLQVFNQLSGQRVDVVACMQRAREMRRGGGACEQGAS